MLLKYDFAAVNQDKLRHALRSIESDMLRHNRRVAEMGVTARRRASQGGTTGAVAGVPTPAVAAKMAEQSARAQQRAQEKVDRETQKAHERAEREKTRIAAREAAARSKHEERVQLYNQRLRDQHFRLQTRQAEAAEKNRTRLAERETSARSRAEERHAAYQRKLRDQHFRDEQLRAEAVATSQERMRQRISSKVRGVGAGTISTVTSVGRTALAMTGLAGGALFANAIHGTMSKQARASELANQLLGNEATPEKLTEAKKQILSTTSGIRGMADEQTIAGMSAFQGLAGEGEATMKIAPRLVQTQLATGGNIEEIGQMYASVYASLRNSAGGAQKSVDQLIDETDKMGMVFAAMGQKGAIELKDFAGIGATVTAVATRYGGTQAKNIKDVAAVAQIARQTGGADSSAEAATALSSFTADLIQHGATAKNKFGVDVYADKSKTKLKGLPDVISELLMATGGNLEKMSDIANIRGIKSLTGFQDPYLEAYRGAKSAGKSEDEAKRLGGEAVRKRLAEFGGIEMTTGERDTKAESRLSDADKLLEENFRRLNEAVGNELIPEVTKLIPALAKLTPYMVDLANGAVKLTEWFSSLTITEGLGVVVGAALTKEIAAAGIGAILTGSANLFASVVTKMAALVGLGGAAPVATTAAATTAATTTGGATSGIVTGTLATVGGGSAVVGGALVAGAALTTGASAYGMYKSGEAREQMIADNEEQIKKRREEAIVAANGDTGKIAAAENKYQEGRLGQQILRADNYSMATGGPGGGAHIGEAIGIISMLKELIGSSSAKQDEAAKSLKDAGDHLKSLQAAPGGGVAVNRSNAPAWNPQSG